MTVPQLTGVLGLIYVLVYAFAFPLDVAFTSLAARFPSPIRLPGRKPAAQRVADILGGQVTPPPDLIRLEKRRQSRKVSICISTTLLTLASFAPLLCYFTLVEGITVLGLEPTTKVPYPDLENFFTTMLTLPLLNVIVIAALRGTLRTGEPSDALLWNIMARLLANEDAPRKTWRARAQARTRFLDEATASIRRDLSTFGMRDRRRRIDVNPSPLIEAWKLEESKLPFAISLLDRQKVREFLILWSAGDWVPIMDQCEVSSARKTRTSLASRLQITAYVAILAVVPIGLALAAKKLQLAPELIASITSLASAPLVISLLAPVARRLNYSDSANGLPEQKPPNDLASGSRTTSPSGQP